MKDEMLGGPAQKNSNEEQQAAKWENHQSAQVLCMSSPKGCPTVFLRVSLAKAYMLDVMNVLRPMRYPYSKVLK